MGQYDYIFAYGISIHTPAKGVTDIHYDRGQDKLRISIHTPAKGVTQVMVAGKGGVAYFNPHSRKGSDTRVMIASTKSTYFNPHSRKGSDAENPIRSREGKRFQSTLPQRE